MPNKNKVSKAIYVRWFVLRAILVIYDILAVNAAFFLALITRFYVAREFHSAAIHYINAYATYAPIYTIFCIIVFALFRLYNGMWKYAGLHDLNRVFGANAVCLVGHVVGTLIFGTRMPITFYCIGAVIQVCLIGISRFSYSLLRIEKKALFINDTTAVNALIVGVGSTARSATRAMEHEGSMRPVCMLDYKNENLDALFNGIPVVNGIENLTRSIEKYHVQLVLLASTSIPPKVRTQIQETCTQCGIEVQDYVSYFQSFGNSLSLKVLAECTSGPVELSVGGNRMQFEDCEQAMMSITGKYIVKSIMAKDNILHIELGDNGVVQNDLSAEWVKEQESKTGEEISFF